LPIDDLGYRDQDQDREQDRRHPHGQQQGQRRKSSQVKLGRELAEPEVPKNLTGRPIRGVEIYTLVDLELPSVSDEGPFVWGILVTPALIAGLWAGIVSAVIL
jgi:hypothetical protein